MYITGRWASNNPARRPPHHVPKPGKFSPLKARVGTTIKDRHPKIAIKSPLRGELECRTELWGQLLQASEDRNGSGHQGHSCTCTTPSFSIPSSSRRLHLYSSTLRSFPLLSSSSLSLFSLPPSSLPTLHLLPLLSVPTYPCSLLLPLSLGSPSSAYPVFSAPLLSPLYRLACLALYSCILPIAPLFQLSSSSLAT
ncbi:uncharacterized protein BDV14DRAFT_109507 [Aspergillus stella-maris]|uniref:uncharacterized protein n=1 Tax=Aspergillus stella-maris TaxID=1810926 RepID=UPI003CCDD6C1